MLYFYDTIYRLSVYFLIDYIYFLVDPSIEILNQNDITSYRHSEMITFSFVFYL